MLGYVLSVSRQFRFSRVDISGGEADRRASRLWCALKVRGKEAAGGTEWPSRSISCIDGMQLVQ